MEKSVVVTLVLDWDPSIKIRAVCRPTSQPDPVTGNVLPTGLERWKQTICNEISTAVPYNHGTVEAFLFRILSSQAEYFFQGLVREMSATTKRHVTVHVGPQHALHLIPLGSKADKPATTVYLRLESLATPGACLLDTDMYELVSTECPQTAKNDKSPPSSSGPAFRIVATRNVEFSLRDRRQQLSMTHEFQTPTNPINRKRTRSMSSVKEETTEAETARPRKRAASTAKATPEPPMQSTANDTHPPTQAVDTAPAAVQPETKQTPPTKASAQDRQGSTGAAPSADPDGTRKKPQVNSTKDAIKKGASKETIKETLNPKQAARKASISSMESDEKASPRSSEKPSSEDSVNVGSRSKLPLKKAQDTQPDSTPQENRKSHQTKTSKMSVEKQQGEQTAIAEDRKQSEDAKTTKNDRNSSHAVDETKPSGLVDKTKSTEENSHDDESVSSESSSSSDSSSDSSTSGSSVSSDGSHTLDKEKEIQIPAPEESTDVRSSPVAAKPAQETKTSDGGGTPKSSEAAPPPKAKSDQDSPVDAKGDSAVVAQGVQSPTLQTADDDGSVASSDSSGSSSSEGSTSSSTTTSSEDTDTSQESSTKSHGSKNTPLTDKSKPLEPEKARKSDSHTSKTKEEKQNSKTATAVDTAEKNGKSKKESSVGMKSHDPKSPPGSAFSNRKSPIVKEEHENSQELQPNASQSPLLPVNLGTKLASSEKKDDSPSSSSASSSSDDSSVSSDSSSSSSGSSTSSDSSSSSSGPSQKEKKKKGPPTKVSDSTDEGKKDDKVKREKKQRSSLLPLNMEIKVDVDALVNGRRT